VFCLPFCFVLGPAFYNISPAKGHTVRGAAKLPLNMLDALRAYDKDKVLKDAMGKEFSDAYLKLKMEEWNSFVSHFSVWEKENTLDI
jgi:glutamine synthetase